MNDAVPSVTTSSVAADRLLQRFRDPILRDVWWRLARFPGLILVALAALFAFTSTDLTIAHALYYDPTRQRWIGAGNWWINELLHRQGVWLLRSVVLVAIALCVLSLRNQALSICRRPAAYVAIAGILSVGTIGLLKVVTNVHCPWSLHEFGGVQPYLHLFDPRPAGLRRGACFPASHASSGYALMALHFAFRDRNRRLAHAALTAGIVVGLVFGIAQQSRGAHFVSHDVWSAFLVWFICLGVYTFGFRARLWPTPAAGYTSFDRRLIRPEADVKPVSLCCTCSNENFRRAR